VSQRERLRIRADRFDAVVFDMDGVITDTARVHAFAWKRLFDEYLADHAGADVDRRAFSSEDYRRFVDGRARIDGVEAFLESRGATLARGQPDDSPEAGTAWGLANRKNRYFLDALAVEGPRPFGSSVDLVRALRSAGLGVAVVTASRNRSEVLSAAGIANLFEVHVDGVDAASLDLAGKPDPAVFLEAARRLGTDPVRTVVVEDALAGVEAGRRGGFGLVIGVDRSGRAEALLAAGADTVVADLDEVEVVTAPLSLETTEEDHDPWSFSFEGLDPGDEGHREALCTLGNGVFATRGAAPEARADAVHYPGTYAAGIYNRLVSRIGDRELEHESLVNLPNWLPLSFRPAGGEWLDLTAMEVEGYRQMLDLRRGLLIRCFEVTDRAGRTTSVTERRLVSVRRPSVAALEWLLVPVNWSGRLEIRSGLDAAVENGNVAAEHELTKRHLCDVAVGERDEETLWLTAETSQSRRRIAQIARTMVEQNGRPVVPTRQVVSGSDQVDLHLGVDVCEGEELRIEKVVAVHTSLDPAITEVLSAVITDIEDASDFESLVDDQSLWWRHLWDLGRFEIVNDEPEVARILHLHAFHVLQTLSPNIVDRDVGVPARGLHGEGYRGHVFWDELFVLPYLNFRFPELTRELLLYRYRRLPAARRLASAAGRRGAQYPWQSGSDGREETPTQFFNPLSGRWMADHSQRQHHVSLAIGYELWQYYQVTGDLEFLSLHGGEMLTEIARFWASLAELDPDSGRWSIRGVMGPDEFHDGYPDRPGTGVDDNAYTNVMVSWLLRRAVEVHQLLETHGPADLWERLRLEPDEPSRWAEISHRLHVPFHVDGIISQFAGYEDLLEFDWEAYRSRYDDIGRLDLILEAEDDSPNRYKLSKQADVLMLLYLFSAEELVDLFTHLGYEFDPAIIPRTIDYYTARMSHGSTLCRVAVAWVLARADRPASWQMFCDALSSDVADIQGGTTREGVHLGAMAGTLDLIQRCYTGIEVRNDVLWFSPRLPENLTRLSFPIRYRGHSIDVTLRQEVIRLHARPSFAPSARVAVLDQHFDLSPGRTIEAPLNG
jgi:beta-phosphoglucomutase family hydrolase